MWPQQRASTQLSELCGIIRGETANGRRWLARTKVAVSA